MPEAEQVCRDQEPEESQAWPGQTRGGTAGGGSTEKIQTGQFLTVRLCSAVRLCSNHPCFLEQKAD